LIQLPVLFGMYSAMSQLATTGLTLDQVTQNQVAAGQVVYAAERHQEPLPFNQFVLARADVTLTGTNPVTLDVPQDRAAVQRSGQNILSATQGLTLTPGQAPGNTNPPNTPGGSASVFLRAGARDADGVVQHNLAPTPGQPYVVELWVNAASTNADGAQATMTWDPSLMQAGQVETPPLTDVAFKSRFLWLPSLGEPDLIHVFGFGIPGLLLIVMTITSFLSQRMTTMPTEDPQQQAMMRSMAFMPLMYLFFFLNTPAGLVVYWLISNVFSMFQQYFTVGLGMLGGDLQRLTGRDLQPAWAHVPGSTAPAAALASPTDDGRQDDNDLNGTTPALGGRSAGATRRVRPNGGKGRKRGKR
jgi:hypothetical protein